METEEARKFSQDFMKIFEKYKQAMEKAMNNNMSKLAIISKENNRLKASSLKNKDKDDEIEHLNSTIDMLKSDYNALNSNYKSSSRNIFCDLRI